MEIYNYNEINLPKRKNITFWKRMEVSVLHSADKWFGMTYQEDRAIVMEKLGELCKSGVYSEMLRSNGVLFQNEHNWFRSMPFPKK